MWTRKCPKCGEELNYSTKGNMAAAERKGQTCKKCVPKPPKSLETRRRMSEAARERPRASSEARGRMSAAQKQRGPVSEDTRQKLRANNAMRGKSVYEIWVGKYGVEVAEAKHLEFVQRVSQNNTRPMTGKSFHSVWVEKYGVEEADRRLTNLASKQSSNNSGEGNPMFGRPAPVGSGGGWSGWYNGHYFRSLLELSYMRYLDSLGIRWVTAESKEFLVHYTDLSGKIRTYRPDFYLPDTDEVVELKPVRRVGEPLNLAKSEAARAVFTYKVVTDHDLRPHLLTPLDLLSLVESGVVDLLPKWADRLPQG